MLDNILCVVCVFVEVRLFKVALEVGVNDERDRNLLVEIFEPKFKLLVLYG